MKMSTFSDNDLVLEQKQENKKRHLPILKCTSTKFRYCFPMEEEERQRLSQPDNQHHHAFDRGVRFAGVEPTTAGSSVAEYAPDEESRNLPKRSVWIAEATQSSADKAKQASLRIHEARNKTKIKVGLKAFEKYSS